MMKEQRRMHDFIIKDPSIYRELLGEIVKINAVSTAFQPIMPINNKKSPHFRKA